jgi:hypothetical protein
MLWFMARYANRVSEQRKLGICFQASLEKTSLRNPDDVLDFDEGARIFQNELENIIHREAKAERARKRLTLDLPSQTSTSS